MIMLKLDMENIIEQQNVINSTLLPTTDFLITSEAYQTPFGETEIIWTSVLLIIFFVFGVFANIVTITVILSTQELRTNVFNHFILSLCASDLTSALISWVNLYRRTWGFEEFAIPNFFCVFYWGADIWTSYTTSLHILSFSALRFISVTWPQKFSVISLKIAKIWIICMWVVAFAVGFVPMALFSGAETRNRTGGTVDSKWPSCTQLTEWLPAYQIYIICAYTIFFYLPVIFTIILSIITIVKLAKMRSTIVRSKSISTKAAIARKHKEQQALLQLVLIVGSFLLGYIPFTAYEYFTTNYANTDVAGLRIDWRFGTIQYICLRFSECLNPIFYNIGSSKMRYETLRFLSAKFCCKELPARNQHFSKQSNMSSPHSANTPVHGDKLKKALPTSTLFVIANITNSKSDI